VYGARQFGFHGQENELTGNTSSKWEGKRMVTTTKRTARGKRMVAPPAEQRHCNPNRIVPAVGQIANHLALPIRHQSAESETCPFFGVLGCSPSCMPALMIFGYIPENNYLLSNAVPELSSTIELSQILRNTNWERRYRTIELKEQFDIGGSPCAHPAAGIVAPFSLLERDGISLAAVTSESKETEWLLPVVP